MRTAVYSPWVSSPVHEAWGCGDFVAGSQVAETETPVPATKTMFPVRIASRSAASGSGGGFVMSSWREGGRS